MIIDREELAWAAGFFDGEGTTHVSRHTKVKNGVRSREYLQLQVSVSQVGDECLQRFQSAVGGLGRIYQFARPHGFGAQPLFRWQATSFEGAQAVVALLWSFLSNPKREQAAQCLLSLRDYHIGVMTQ